MTLTPDDRQLIATAIRAGRNLSDLAEDYDVPVPVIRELAAERSGGPAHGPANEPERLAHQAVAAAPDPLDDAGRARVLRWARGRVAPSALGATTTEGQP